MATCSKIANLNREISQAGYFIVRADGISELFEEAKRSETRCNQIIIHGLQIEENIRSQMDTFCPRA